jgi:hypothetical protein
MKIKFFALLVFSSLAFYHSEVFGQDTNYFEGVSYSSFILSDSSGQRLPFAWEELEEYFSKNHILQRITKATIMVNYDMYLDSEKHLLYRIDHDERTIEKIERFNVQKIIPLEFKKTGEEKVLGYDCDVYFVRYVNNFENLNAIMPVDPLTMSCTYFIAKDLKILNAGVFARLQENCNSKLFDGRFDGLALRVIREYPNGDKLVIETTKVEERDIQELIKLPDYPSVINPARHQYMYSEVNVF